MVLGWLFATLLTAIEEFETFEEWNPDPVIAVRQAFSFDNAGIEHHCSIQNAARRLYGHVDNLELYVCSAQIQYKRQPCD